MIVLPSVRDNCIDLDHHTTMHARSSSNTGLDIRRQWQVLLRQQARHDAFLNKHTRADVGGGESGVRGQPCLPHASCAAGAVKIVDGVQWEVEVDDVLGGNSHAPSTCQQTHLHEGGIQTPGGDIRAN